MTSIPHSSFQQTIFATKKAISLKPAVVLFSQHYERAVMEEGTLQILFVLPELFISLGKALSVVKYKLIFVWVIA